MQRSQGKYLVLGIVLMATIGVKLNIQSIIKVPTRYDQIQAFKATLESQGYDVMVQAGALDDDAYMLAMKGACLMTIAAVPPEDANVYFNSHRFVGDNRTGFVFDGKYYDRRSPVLAPLLQQAWYRLMSYIGVSVPFKSIMAISASKVCKVD